MWTLSFILWLNVVPFSPVEIWSPLCRTGTMIISCALSIVTKQSVKHICLSWKNCHVYHELSSLTSMKNYGRHTVRYTRHVCVAFIWQMAEGKCSVKNTTFMMCLTPNATPAVPLEYNADVPAEVIFVLDGLHLSMANRARFTYLPDPTFNLLSRDANSPHNYKPGSPITAEVRNNKYICTHRSIRVWGSQISIGQEKKNKIDNFRMSWEVFSKSKVFQSLLSSILRLKIETMDEINRTLIDVC